MAIRLAKEGYYGGNPQSILDADAYIVKGLLNYEAFEADYESEFISLNSGD